MKKISLAYIAKLLGVSPTLVSMVLNGKGDDNGISADTQKRVIEKAKELNYIPNQAARSLRIGKSETIGLIVSDISNPFYAKIAGRIEKIASQKGYNLFVCSSYEDSKRELELIQIMKNRNVDGLIISSSLEDLKIFEQLKTEKYPFVLIDRMLDIEDANSVTVDNYNGAYEATSHLIQNGFSKIAFFSITPLHLNTIKDRTRGYKNALADNNFEFNENYIQTIRFDNIDEDTDLAVKNILASNIGIQAIFTANNSIAISCMKALRKRKIRIPHDIALISFDDIDLFEFSYPRITSVSQPVESIGDEAINLIFQEIKNKGNIAKKSIVVSVELKKRESCGEMLM